MAYAKTAIKEVFGLTFLAAILVPIMQSVVTSANISGVAGTVLTYAPTLLVVILILHIIDVGF
jgi:hypothetical protein